MSSCNTSSDSGRDGGCQAGKETCPCQAGGICEGNLTCAADLGNVCVHLAGTPPVSTGGTTGTQTGAGATTGSGGSTGAGGTAPATGGTSGAKGGSGGTGTGGAKGGSGGTGTGGTTTGTGGAKGGSTGTGGMTSGGTGGAAATSCGTIGPAVNGSGEFTHYNFGQGTAHGELGDYQTACGYLGTESGTTDTVMNISNTSPAKNTYFAAIPGDGSFNSDKYCGACVQISNGGSTIVATIIDECPESSNPICQQNANGELDLSVDAFNALNFGNGNPQGTSWKFVPCAITGNIIVRVKQVNELYIENVILPIQSVSGPGGNASRTTYGTWHFNSNISGGSTLTLTDSASRTLSVTLANANVDQNQDTGKQFPKCQ